MIGLVEWESGFLFRNRWHSSTEYAAAKDPIYAWWYMGFVEGIEYSLEIDSDINVPTGPSAPTLTQTLYVVGKYLDNHPDLWNQPDVVLVRNALLATWGAKKQ